MTQGNFASKTNANLKNGNVSQIIVKIVGDKIIGQEIMFTP